MSSTPFTQSSPSARYYRTNQELDLAIDPNLASLFLVNDRVSALLRDWLARDLPIPRRPKAKYARAIVIVALGKAYKTHRAIVGLCRAGYGEDAEVLLRT